MVQKKGPRDHDTRNRFKKVMGDKKDNLRSKFKVVLMDLKWVLVLICATSLCVNGSEFPDRECCDPVYPPNTATTPSAPVTHPISKSGTPTIWGPGIKGTIAILNCLLARQLCFEDASCSAILEIIPRVCGSELVACSTVTVTKCQAALRTLQAFPFFKPTCLCREPNVDPECNSFRDFLFDHPCVFVLKKERDPYPVETLPTCTYALSVCSNEKACSAVVDRFKIACKAREGECRMDNRSACREAWVGLRMSPLFGCICPNTHMKKRCDRIFSMINHNPCVAAMWGDSPASVRALFVSTRRPLTRVADVTRYSSPDGTILLLTENGTRLLTREGAAKLLGDALRFPRDYDQGEPPPHNDSALLFCVCVERGIPLHASATLTGGRQDKNGTLNSWVGGMSYMHDGNLIVPDKIIRHIHRYSSPHFNPHGDHLHHWNHEPGGYEGKKTVYGAGYIDGNMRIGKENSKTGVIDESSTKVALQSTCHLALDACIKDTECVSALTPVLQRCHTTDCDIEGCMAALRGFYRKPGVPWNTEIAFCLCKKTDNKEDSCMNAQERLHPVCAQRPPIGTPLPACNSLAHECREEPECRMRLENYEQWCAVDTVTQGCAGSPAACRAAVVAVLGTNLRAACVCRGNEVSQLYECLGWQRLLWLNPCVVESQSDYHIKTYGSLMTTTPFDNGIRYITVPPEPSINLRSSTLHYPEKEANIIEHNPMSEQTVVPNEIGQISEPVVVESTTEITTVTTPTTTTTTKATTTTTTTRKPTTTPEPTKYCVVKKPENEDEAQYIKMGETRRLYRSAELAECTDLCVCEMTLQVSCKVACVPRAPCSSRLAHYSHAAPAYQAYRGRCYCYSGSFICMRPNPGEYKLPEGVYLLLGFSSVDESLLRPHTGLGAEDAVRLLQQYLYSVHQDRTNCTLTLYNISNENVIISASVPPKEQEELRENGEDLLDREKEECIDVLKVVKARINTQHEDISSHLLLSIFKIAEVDVVYPTPPSSAISNLKPTKSIILLFSIVATIYNVRNLMPLFVLFLSFLEKLLNFLTNLIKNNSRSHCLAVTSHKPISTVAIMKPGEKKYFVKDDSIKKIQTILKIYYNFIDINNDVSVVTVVDDHHEHALRSSTSDAQMEHIIKYKTIIDVRDKDRFNIKETKHIIDAVSITIFTYLNVLNADVYKLKYFSRNVYYIDENSIDIEMLFGENDFGNIASFSYGIVQLFRLKY